MVRNRKIHTTVSRAPYEPLNMQRQLEKNYKEIQHNKMGGLALFCFCLFPSLPGTASK